MALRTLNRRYLTDGIEIIITLNGSEILIIIQITKKLYFDIVLPVAP